MARFRRYIAGDAALVTLRAPLIGEFEGLEGICDGGAVPPGEAWTFEHQGFVLGVGGLAPVWPTRAIAWTAIGELTPFQWGQVGRFCAARISAALLGPCLRVEATTPATFAPGCRLLEWLGFEREGLLRHWGPDGADHYSYARVDP